MVHVTFFAGEDDCTAGVCLKGLRCLHLVGQFHLRLFYRFAGNVIGNDDRVTHWNAEFGVVILKTRREDYGKCDEGEEKVVFQNGPFFMENIEMVCPLSNGETGNHGNFRNFQFENNAVHVFARVDNVKYFY